MHFAHLGDTHGHCKVSGHEHARDDRHIGRSFKSRASKTSIALAFHMSAGRKHTSGVCHSKSGTGHLIDPLDWGTEASLYRIFQWQLSVGFIAFPQPEGVDKSLVRLLAPLVAGFVLMSSQDVRAISLAIFESDCSTAASSCKCRGVLECPLHMKHLYYMFLCGSLTWLTVFSYPHPEYASWSMGAYQ